MESSVAVRIPEIGRIRKQCKRNELWHNVNKSPRLKCMKKDTKGMPVSVPKSELKNYELLGRENALMLLLFAYMSD